jgi:hypothetical protein
MHLPNETTSQKADGEFELPEQTGEENRRLTSASNNEPGRKSKRDKSITQHEEDQAGRGSKEDQKERKGKAQGAPCSEPRCKAHSQGEQRVTSRDEVITDYHVALCLVHGGERAVGDLERR